MKSNKYKLQLTESKEAPQTIEFEFENHDDLFSLIERIKTNGPLSEVGQNIELLIGLKLFGEVMLKHRNHPLFEEFAPAFGQFMKKLKGRS